VSGFIKYKKQSSLPTRSFQTPPPAPPELKPNVGDPAESELGEFRAEFYAQFRERLRQVVRDLLEQTLQAELDLFLAAQNGERGVLERRGYRNGYYERDLVTSEGKLADLRVPRDREGEFQTQAFARYARYQPEIVEGLNKCL
jgi:transposase-like protein